MITTQEAIASLRPNAEYTMNDNDIENIHWISDVQPVSVAEVEAEMVRLEQAEQARLEADSAATAAAIAHAKSLGFTDQMIAVMYPNLGAQS